MTEARPPHPGSVLFIERPAGTRREVRVEELPPHVAYLRTREGYFAVTRVETVMRENDRSVRLYGVDGTLLQSRIEVLNPSS